MDINQASAKVEAFMATYKGAGGKSAKEVRVRPSGDDATEIKIWVDVGSGVSDDDCDAWARQCEKDLAKLAGEFHVHVRAESL